MPQCFKCSADAKVGDFAIWDEQTWLWVRNAIDQWAGNRKGWERQSESQVIWNQKDVDASDIYCESCWKDWGQHVKAGCKYALSKACEELAVRVGIQWVDPSESSHSGNPFYCPHCKAFYNHGAPSLEKHLFESHKDQVSLKPACIESGRRMLWHMRTLAHLAHLLFTSHVVAAFSRESIPHRAGIMASHFIRRLMRRPMMYLLSSTFGTTEMVKSSMVGGSLQEREVVVA